MKTIKYKDGELLENLYSRVSALLEEDVSPKRRKELISRIIRDAEKETSDRNSHIFTNQLNKIKALFEKKLSSTQSELSRYLRGLLSEIHNYLPHYQTF